MLASPNIQDRKSANKPSDIENPKPQNQKQFLI